MSLIPRRRISEASDALIAVAPLISRWIERLLADSEPPLTLAQFLTLRSVAAGVDSNVELARHAAVSGPAVSQLVSSLVEAGLLQRGQAAGDRRRLALEMSIDGQRALKAASRRVSSRLTEVLAALPAHEADALALALPSVSAMLAGTPPPRRSHPQPPAPPGPPHSL